jgi:hypothetical protein
MAEELQQRADPPVMVRVTVADHHMLDRVSFRSPGSGRHAAPTGLTVPSGASAKASAERRGPGRLQQFDAVPERIVHVGPLDSGQHVIGPARVPGGLEPLHHGGNVVDEETRVGLVRRPERLFHPKVHADGPSGIPATAPAGDWRRLLQELQTEEPEVERVSPSLGLGAGRHGQLDMVHADHHTRGGCRRGGLGHLIIVPEVSPVQLITGDGATTADWCAGPQVAGPGPVLPSRGDGQGPDVSVDTQQIPSGRVQVE